MRAFAFLCTLAYSAAFALAAPAATCTYDDQVKLVNRLRMALIAGHPGVASQLPFTNDFTFVLGVLGDPLPIGAGVPICHGPDDCRATVAALSNIVSDIGIYSYTPEPGRTLNVPGNATFGAESIGIVTVQTTGNVSFNADCQLTYTFAAVEPLRGADIPLINRILGILAFECRPLGLE